MQHSNFPKGEDPVTNENSRACDWIIWGGNALNVGHTSWWQSTKKDLEEGSFYFLSACPYCCWKVHLSCCSSIPSLVSKPSSSGFQSRPRTGSTSGIPWNSSIRPGLLRCPVSLTDYYRVLGLSVGRQPMMDCSNVGQPIGHSDKSLLNTYVFALSVLFL